MDKLNTEEIAPLTVLDESGQAVPLRSLWAKQPTVLALVRHFG